MVDYDSYWQAVHKKKDEKRTRLALNRKVKFLKKRNKKARKKRQKKSKILRARKSKKYNDLRKFVINRAAGRCELCCIKTDGFTMHHIEMVKDAPKRILDEKNVVTICSVCHREIHPWIR